MAFSSWRGKVVGLAATAASHVDKNGSGKKTVRWDGTTQVHSSADNRTYFSTTVGCAEENSNKRLRWNNPLETGPVLNLVSAEQPNASPGERSRLSLRSRHLATDVGEGVSVEVELYVTRALDHARFFAVQKDWLPAESPRDAWEADLPSVGRPNEQAREGANR